MSFGTQPEYNADLRFPHSSGIVEALQNDLTLKASTSGDVLVSSPAALRPEVDASQDLGLEHLRWRNLNVSGINDTPIENYINSSSRATLIFTPTSGTEFVMQHDLGSEDFMWNMWKTDTFPIEVMYPDNLAPSGINHVLVTLSTSVSGKIVMST